MPPKGKRPKGKPQQRAAAPAAPPSNESNPMEFSKNLENMLRSATGTDGSEAAPSAPTGNPFAGMDENQLRELQNNPVFMQAIQESPEFKQMQKDYEQSVKDGIAPQTAALGKIDAEGGMLLHYILMVNNKYYLIARCVGSTGARFCG